MATYQSTHTGAQIDAAVDAVDEKLPLTGGTVTGNLTVNGNISTQGIVKLDNEQSVQFKDSGSTYRSMLGLTSSNNCLVGSGTIQASGNTIVLGKNLYFRANSTSENALTIDTNKAATFASSVTATSFIGNLTGNADTATSATSSTSATTADKLSVVSKTMMGRTYWTSGGVPTNIKGTLYMISDESDASTLTNSAKLKFNSYDADGTQIRHSPYIQAITASSSSYGRKRLSVFQSNTTNWNDDFTEVFTILPNGNVGIGTVSPTTKLGVSGDVDITGSLSFNGTAVATVYSGSSAPSSSTGSDGDIYIQTS